MEPFNITLSGITFKQPKIDVSDEPVGPIDINSSKNTKSMQNREHGRQVSVHGNDDITSPTEQPVVAHLDQVQST